MKAKALQRPNQPNIGRSLEVTPFKFLLRALKRQDFSEHVSPECLNVGEHVVSECSAVGPVAVDSEVCVSSAAVLLKQEEASNTSQTDTRSECAVGVVGECFEEVGVSPLSPSPQSVCTFAGRSEGVCASLRVSRCSSARVGRSFRRSFLLKALLLSIAVLAVEARGGLCVSARAKDGFCRGTAGEEPETG